MNDRRQLLALAGAGALAALTARTAAAAGPAASAGPRDVLGTPALKSPLAPRALLNGLARAGERLVAVGQRGHVLTSDDGGGRWRQARVPVSSDLVAVHFPTPRVGYAVGHDGVVLHTADGGDQWLRILDGHRIGRTMVAWYAGDEAAAALDAKRLAAWQQEAARFAAQGAENPLLDVWFENAQVGYAVGAFGQVFRTRNGGEGWEPLLHLADNPKALHLYAVRGIAGRLWFAGEQGLLLELDDSGSAPRLRAVELPYKGTLFGVTGDTRTLLAFGLRGSVLRSTDGGRQWQPVASGVQSGLTAGTVTADGRFVLVSQAGHVLVSRDDGARFVPLKLERPLPAAAVIEAAPGRLLVAGPRGVHTVALG